MATDSKAAVAAIQGSIAGDGFHHHRGRCNIANLAHRVAPAESQRIF